MTKPWEPIDPQSLSPKLKEMYAVFLEAVRKEYHETFCEKGCCCEWETPCIRG